MTFQKKSQATVECMNLKFQISNLGCRCSFARQQYVDSSSRHRRDEIVQGSLQSVKGGETGQSLSEDQYLKNNKNKDPAMKTEKHFLKN